MKREILDFNDPNKTSRKMEGTIAKKGIRAHMHFHEEFEFLYVTQGAMNCYTEDLNFMNAKEGEIIFVNSGVGHKTEYAVDDSQALLVQFKYIYQIKKNLQHLSSLNKYTQTPLFVFKKDDKDYEQVKRIFFSIFENSDKKDFISECNVMSGIYSMMAILYRRDFFNIGDKVSDITDSIKSALEYIDQNHSREITLESLADITGFNKDYFSRLFKKHTDTNVTEYINFVRICKATELMDSTYTLSEIASNVGFSSLSYFNRMFKKYKHFTPSEYRKMKHISKNKI